MFGSAPESCRDQTITSACSGPQYGQRSGNYVHSATSKRTLCPLITVNE